MFKRIVSQQQVDIVSLADAKAQLNIIDDDSENEHIQSLIDGATNLAERYTNRIFSSGTVEALLGKGSYFIPLGKAESVSVLDADGGSVNYSFNVISQKLVIHDNVIPESLTATFNILGLTQHESSIAALGIKMLISSMYENREDTVTMSVSDIPLNSVSILDAIKLPEV